MLEWNGVENNVDDLFAPAAACAYSGRRLGELQ